MKTFLLFDIDGTLLHSDRLDSQCFAASYEAVFARPFPSIDWSRYPHVTDHVIFRTVFTRHFGRAASAEERRTFEAHYLAGLRDQRQCRPEQFREVPGARALWEELSRSDRYLTGIATGGWRAPARLKLDHVGIHPDPLYAGYADGMETRDDILRTAIELARRDHTLDRVVYIGDAIWDVRTTQRMKIPLVGVRHRGDHEVLTTVGARFVIDDYRDPTLFFRIVEQAASATSGSM